MNESPTPNGQSPKSSRHFAVEIIARLAARVRAAVRVLSGAWEHRASNIELRTSNEDVATSSSKSEQQNLAHPLLPKGELEVPGKERKEFAGDEGRRRGERAGASESLGRSEEVNNNIGEHAAHDFEAITPRPGPPPAWASGTAGEHPTSHLQRRTSNEERAAHPGTASVSLASFATGPEPHTPADSQSVSALRVPSLVAPNPARQGDGGAAFNADLVSRQELKRELESLRRLIESRK
jgi:hypothetical protein